MKGFYRDLQVIGRPYNSTRKTLAYDWGLKRVPAVSLETMHSMS